METFRDWLLIYDNLQSLCDRSQTLCSSRHWVKSSAELFACYVALGKFLNLSGLCCLQL
jgi:O-succinylbenzoate synthase